MSPVRRKFPPWELMARATKYEPQVGASGGARAVRMMYFFYLLPMMYFFHRGLGLGLGLIRSVKKA